jgi:hypothetical protein
MATLIIMMASSSRDEQILKVKKSNTKMQSLIKFSAIQMNGLCN